MTDVLETYLSYKNFFVYLDALLELEGILAELNNCIEIHVEGEWCIAAGSTTLAPQTHELTSPSSSSPSSLVVALFATPTPLRLCG